MNRAILARNLLILKQAEEIIHALERYHVKAVLLKGIALIEAIPQYAHERTMDDIDLFFQPHDIRKVRVILSSLGYKPLYHDPWSFYNPEKPAYIDICDNLWYLDKQENETVFKQSDSYPIVEHTAFHLPPDDLYIHILAHAAAHHAMKETKWMRDLELIKQTWQKEINWNTVREKLKAYGFAEISEEYLMIACPSFLRKPESRTFKYGLRIKAFRNDTSVTLSLYRWLTNHDVPQRGHVIRFILLPFAKKLSYLFSTLFPSNDFLVHRYGIHKWMVPVFRILRPVFLLGKLAGIPFKRLFQ